MPVARSKEERFPFSRLICKFILLEESKSNLCSFYATISENTEVSETTGSLKKWGKRKVITTQTTQTSYLRIAYKTCSLLLWTKLLTAMILQRNLKKTWVHENIIRERKTLLPFDLVLKLKWQNQNALPSAIGFALPFRALPVSSREFVLTWYLLRCKTIAHITVQTNLLINLGLIFHGQKGSTSRCRVGWTTNLPGIIHTSTLEIPGSTESKPSSWDITISKTFQKKN